MADYKYADSVVSLGNTARIAGVMKRALNNEQINIGFLGGSITMGSGASSPKKCYAWQVYRWWVEKFSNKNVYYINAGIGATTSEFGVARAESDLLRYRPDFVIAEFSVNDENNEHYMETYEGMIRKVLLSPTFPAAMIVNNLYYDNGKNAQKIHNEVGEAYGLPMISVRDYVYPHIKNGMLNANDLTSDMLHPNDKGHKLVADIIIEALERIYDIVTSGKADRCSAIPRQTLTANRYFKSERWQNYNCKPYCNGFVDDKAPQANIRDVFKNGWMAKKTGDSIKFEFECATMSIQFRKTIKKPSGIAMAVLDDNEKNAVRLDGNFDETWGDFICLKNIYCGNDNGKHTLEIKLIEADENWEMPFYLVSVITSRV